MKVKIQLIKPTLEKIIARNRILLKKLLSEKNSDKYTWDNLLAPIDEMENDLALFWSKINHLHMVADSEPLRKAYNDCLPIITKYNLELSQNKKLYSAVKSIRNSQQYLAYDYAKKKVIDNMLRDFHLSGAELEKNAREEFTKLQCELSELQNKFSENVLDATNAWNKIVTNEKNLSGLPEYILNAAKENAQKSKQAGWKLTLHPPFYEAVLTYAENSMLRKEMHLAYITKASAIGKHPKKFDNTKIIDKILDKRLKISRVLKFNNYAELSLATKMVCKPKTVFDFLYKLSQKSRRKAKCDLAELQKFAKQKHGIKKLEPWDIAYYSEKLREEKYSISDELLRKYFPVEEVLNGMFALVKRLFNHQVVERKNNDVWDKNVRFFCIKDNKNNLVGSFYIDLFARQNKHSGAWMDIAATRRRTLNNELQHPIAYLICNFAKAISPKESFITHHDVLTLFHEFGHTLQHLLTRVDYTSVSGVNGVPWDAVELASQFMEHWCWQKETLNKITRHEETGKKLPGTILNKMLLARNYHAALLMLRQIEFALFDFHLHSEFDPKKNNQAQNILNMVRKKISVVPVAKENRFQNSFAHIFAGGYAAGYYSYKWAEVMACDAFAKFLEDGIFNKKTALSFLNNILETGGAVDPMECFKKFRGREPDVNSLIKLNL